MQAVQAHGIDSCYYQNIKDGKDAPNSAGKLIPNAQLSSDPKAVKSYAFCSDTAYFPEIIPQIKGVTALYHESTFLETEADLATKTKHSTAQQAAKIATCCHCRNPNLRALLYPLRWFRAFQRRG